MLEYLKTNNGAQSAIAAGYSKKTARIIATQNLSKLYIKKAIDEGRKKIESECIADAKEVLEFWATMMRDGTTNDKHRIACSVNIAKYLGMFIERSISLHGEITNEMILRMSDKRFEDYQGRVPEQLPEQGE